MRTTRDVGFLLVLLCALSCDRCTRRNAPRVRAEAGSEAAVRAEARAFYRDLDARNSAALLDHFWPAKVVARWEPPFESRAARGPELLSAAILPAARDATAEECMPADAAVSRAELSIEGRWARAIVPRCTERDDELWLFEMEGHWKIVRLALSGER